MISGNLARRRTPGLLLACLSVALLCGLSGCGAPGPAGYPAAQVRAYAPPGPPSDPWGPYIRDASTRFGVPETWIREVMRRESGGRQYMGGSLTTSSQGAMGLMQVMPATYEELRTRYGLDSDPYHPYNNILAGTAYIREMYERFGFPSFLAAYNAGPGRLEDYLYDGRPLPAETTAYLAAVAPRLSASAEAWGPLAAYARVVPEVSADDLNRSALAALPDTAAVPAVSSVPATSYAVAEAGSPADELNRRVMERAPAGPVTASAYDAPPPVLDGDAAGASATALNERVLAANASTPAVTGGPSIQVGAFSSPAQARAAADSARVYGGGLLSATQTAVTTVTLADGSVLYRARLVGISPALADAACDQLVRQRVACIVLPSGRST